MRLFNLTNTGLTQNLIESQVEPVGTGFDKLSLRKACNDYQNSHTRSLSRLLYWSLLVTVLAILSTASSPLILAETEPAPINQNRTIHMGRATWDTGWFQAEIFKQLFETLGYTVDGPHTFDNEAFYQAVTQGEVDVWVNGWFPQHESYLTAENRTAIEVVGYEVQGGALQGYLIDKTSAETFNITSLADFKRPEVLAHFDSDGDGRANLIGCDEGWGCAETIEHHLDAYALREVIEHVQGDYGPLMLDTLSRFENDDPVFFYTWTPNWTVGALVPGQDVVWLEVPFPSLPENQHKLETDMAIAQVEGCVRTPCVLGFPPNDVRTVANTAFLEANPAIRVLLEQVVIPIHDISRQNARLLAGEDDRDDITQHAEEWIIAHQTQVDAWLAEARTVDRIDRQTKPPSPNTDFPTATGQPTLRIATKTFEPFVIYNVQTNEYTGFSVELWSLIAKEMGLKYELYSVNSIAKLLDEVERGAADAATAGIGVTSQREMYLNFSHPYFESGLQILVNTENEFLWGDSIITVVRGFFSADLLRILGLLLIALLLAAHLIWFFERKDNPDFSLSYWTGIWEAFWWSAVTATTVGYGDKTPKTFAGRIVGLVWMFVGLFVLASFTAGVAATFALHEVEGRITGPQDLAGKQVATIERSTAADYLVAQGIQAKLFENEQYAYQALLDNQIEALVFDAPVLQHYAANEGKGRVKTVGTIFQAQNYGIAFPTHSPHEEAINLALLRLIERGEYQRLYQKWFGEN